MSIPNMHQFSPAFEAHVVHHLTHNKGFARMFGPHIDVEMFSTESGKIVWKAVESIHKDIDDWPGHPDMVTQRISSYFTSGLMSGSDVLKATDLVNEVLPSQAIPPDEMKPELVSLLKTRARLKFVDDTARAVVERRDLTQYISRLEQIETIGQSDIDDSDWVSMDDSVFDWLANAGRVRRMTTGIIELDIFLNGGLPYKTLTTIIGGSGVGKSFMLSQLASTAVFSGLNALYISLENTDSMAMERLLAPILGMEILDIAKNPETAKRRMAKVRSQRELGNLRVKKYESGTAVELIRDAVRKMCEKTRFTPDIIAFDYVGEAGSVKAQGGSAHSRYMMLAEVARVLKAWAEETGAVMCSAAQSARKQTPGKRSRLTLDDIADSMNIVRVSDNVLTLNAVSEQQEGEKERLKVCLGVPKHRSGASGDHTSDKYEQRKYGLFYPSDLFTLDSDPFSDQPYKHTVVKRGK